MANKMLIDATHPEETRVVVLRGNRVEEFDFESAHRKQLRGNIYLAKVTRVEPSLQAAFVDYGGNRHGFLAFSEIHPDYYQIPVADRQALIDEEQQAQLAADDELDRRSHRHRGRGRHAASRRDDDVVRSHPETADSETAAPVMTDQPSLDQPSLDQPSLDQPWADQPWADQPWPQDTNGPSPDNLEGTGGATDQPEAEPSAMEQLAEARAEQAEPAGAEPGEPYPSTAEATAEAAFDGGSAENDAGGTGGPEAEPSSAADTAAVDTDTLSHSRDSHQQNHQHDGHEDEDGDNSDEIVESVGGADALEEVPDRAPRYRRQYKIQEVIKRRQVMLVQVVKEERGTKGAALTTYLSLAGRYSVLMPNTARGGGISRKITSAEDRGRLKEIAQELEVPEGMGVILRTAGASRTKTEIKRDFEYLLRLWETVRDLTLKSTAPKLVYEEGSLVKRSIRDLYSKEIDDVLVAGNEAYQEAKDFMRMLMPSHAKNVKPYSETQPLLSRHGVENQLDAMFSPVVQLRSGGYIVINQTEALVAIDVNSGRATREHHIEDTALKTNQEAADEIARQLRLRDLAGLIVIDFIDMDEKRNNRSVERRLKECLKQDRARIQVGRISHFGLLEMSRQRIRASVLESSTEKCPYCGGSGHVRSVSSLALQVLRALEEQLMRAATHNLIARTRPDVALYVLNQKRAHLRGLEERFVITITISADETVHAPQAFVIERGEQVHTPEAARALAEQSAQTAAPIEEDLEDLAGAEVEEAEEVEAEANGAEREGGPRRRRRRRGRGRGRDNGERGEASRQDESPAADAADEREGEDFIHAEPETPAAGEGDEEPSGEEPQFAEGEEHAEPQGERRRRRRGRRGGRRNRHEREHNGEHDGEHDRDAHGLAPESEFAPDQVDSPAVQEQDLRDAVTDPDTTQESPGRDADEPSPAAPFEEASPAPESETRRRSTVREPAPGTGGAATPPSATPPLESHAPEIEENASADRPRRTGWWSRRSAG